MSKPNEYRANVGIVIFNVQGLVLVGKRKDYGNGFQFPQGGMEAGEKPLETAYRELKEETSLDLKGTQPIFEYKDWLYYDFPKDIPERLRKFCGQKQKWFFFFWNGEISLLNSQSDKDAEFSTLQWADFQSICENIVPFKKEIYKKLYHSGKNLINTYLDETQK